MVVMLRSKYIPARWEKGFTGGEKTGKTVEGRLGTYDVYEVTNANAHSWVEVFFQEVGWVPFEPTQGFINLMDVYEENEDLGENENDLNDEDQENNEEIEINEPEIPVPEELEDNAAPVQQQDSSKRPPVNKMVIGLVSLIFLFIMIIIYRSRLKLRTFYLTNKLERKYSYTTFHSAYHHLLRVLADK